MKRCDVPANAMALLLAPFMDLIAQVHVGTIQPGRDVAELAAPAEGTTPASDLIQGLELAQSAADQTRTKLAWADASPEERERM